MDQKPPFDILRNLVTKDRFDSDVLWSILMACTVVGPGNAGDDAARLFRASVQL